MFLAAIALLLKLPHLNHHNLLPIPQLAQQAHLHQNIQGLFHIHRRQVALYLLLFFRKSTVECPF